jgi:Ca-activated chloride channel family protein
MTRIRVGAAGIVFLLTVFLKTPSLSSQSTAPPSAAQQQQNQEPSAPHPQSGSPAATPAQQGSTRSRIITRTDLVIVPVTAKNGQGQLVGDLTKDEFRVFADSVEQQVILFDSNPFPLSAVVLIGNNLSDKPAEQVQKSLQAIAGGFGPNDEVALVTYDSYQTTVAEFSKSNDDLLTQLKRLEIGSHSAIIVDDPTTAPPTINGKPLPDGTGPPAHGSGRPANDTALYDAVYAAADMLKTRGRDRRKIIFLVSDGSNSKHNTHTFDETIHALLADDVTVYSISVSHSLPIGKALVQKGASELQKFAFDTGGDTFVGSKQPDLERLYSDLTEEARNQYTLTFSPQDIHKDKDFHIIEVRVRRPGLDVTTRQGYYQSAIGIGH